MRDIEIMVDINAENERIATDINEKLHELGVYTINIIGAPGAGKTSCLLNIIQGLDGVSCSVIEGDIQSDIDTEKLKSHCIDAVQINTGGACHIDAVLIEKTLDKLELCAGGMLFIENIGNLVCPAEFSIGEDMKVLIVTVTEGADKPYKYPLAFERAAAIILNKADLLPYIDFDMDYFVAGVRALNEHAPIFIVSTKTGSGFPEVCEWVRTHL